MLSVLGTVRYDWQVNKNQTENQWQNDDNDIIIDRMEML